MNDKKANDSQLPDSDHGIGVSSDNNEILKLLVAAVQDYAIFALDPTGRILTWNTGAERFKGYSAREIVGKHFSTFYTKEDRDRKHPEHELELARKTGKYEEEGWRVRKDGSHFWANVVITALYDTDGTLKGFAKVTRDLTDRKAAEAARIEDQRKAAALEQIQENERVLDQLFGESPSFIALISVPDFKYLKANQQFKTLIGRQELIGRVFFDTLPDKNKLSLRRILETAVRTKTPYLEREFTLHIPSSEENKTRAIHIDMSCQPLEHSDGIVYAIALQGYDVTEMVNARAAAERNSMLLKAISEATPDFIFAKDLQGRMMFANPAVYRTLNQPEESILGHTDSEFLGPELGDEIMENDRRIMSSGVSEALEEVIRAGERPLIYRSVKMPYRNAQNEIIGLLGMSRDYTELREAQLKSRLEAEKSLRLLENIPAPFFAVKSDWVIEYFNPAAEDALNISAASVVGRNLWEAFPGLKATRFGEIFTRVQAERGRGTAEDFYPEFNSWYEIWAYPFADGIAVSFFDITERKNVQARLEASESRYRILTDSLPQLVWTCMPDGRADFLSRQWVEYTGLPEAEQLNLNWIELVIHPDDKTRVFEHWMGAVSGLHEYDIDYRIRRHDGEYRWFKTRGTAMKNESGQILHWFGTCTDIQDQIESASQLQIAKEQAERANQLKSAFLANMSHEIRTPLGAIIGFTDLLRNPALTQEEHANYINIVTRNGHQLAEIINDILDLSKVEAGHLTLEYDHVQPEEILTDVISLLRVKANEKDLLLDLTVDASMRPTFSTDGLRLRQIVMNLVGNAIKFTQTGSVKVRCFENKNIQGVRTLNVEVTDTGIGIQGDAVEKVFEAFVQADGSLSRRFGGTGLGLALSRELARHLGGDIRITSSKVGVGSTFLLEIPDRSEFVSTTPPVSNMPDSNDALEANALQNIRILVVDDSADNRQMLSHYLRAYGAIVEFAENGFMGYKSALASNFDIVLMDIQMPEMDGYTATQKLREAGYRAPIIALTAHAMSEVRQKCLNIGFTDHLTKPLKKIELIHAVRRLVRKRVYGPTARD